tara:strand:- start:162 stop:848 length:687 start_codon:yes stop_codon:yes gene_type:complete
MSSKFFEFNKTLGYYYEDFNKFLNYLQFKRKIDILFSILFLFILAPLFLCISILILLNSRGPIFFKHERIGKNNKKFKCLKFRTMYVDSESRLEKILKKDENILKEFNETYKIKKDPRVFPFGKFLRRTSLDELPQFINVLDGDMSIIGPRPIVWQEKEKYGDHIGNLLSVKPGISGLWQVKGRSKIAYSKRMELDLYYVNNLSFKLDIYIFFKTILVLLLPFNMGAF